MPRRAAAHDHDAAEARALPGRQVEPVEPRRPVRRHQPSTQRVAHRLGLLTDLLEHEVRVRAQGQRLLVPGEIVHRAVLDSRVVVQHPVTVRREHGHVSLGQVDDRLGVAEQGIGVGGDEVLPVPYPEQHGGAPARHDDLLGLGGGDHGDAVRPLDLGQHRDHAFFQRGSGRVFNQVDEGFRVRLGRELMAGAREARPQRIGVLDDAIVHKGERAAAVGVRVGVALRRGTVRRPTRVGDATRPMRRVACHESGERGNPARELPGHDAAPVLHRHARRVVPAVFEPREPFEQDGRGLPPSHVADDAAHRQRSSALRSSSGRPSASRPNWAS